MAQHAFGHGRDTGVGARVGANVAIDAIQTHLHVSVVGKRDWLLPARRMAGKQQAATHPPQSMRLPVYHRIGLTYHVASLTIAFSTDLDLQHFVGGEPGGVRDSLHGLSPSNGSCSRTARRKNSATEVPGLRCLLLRQIVFRFVEADVNSDHAIAPIVDGNDQLARQPKAENSD